MSETIRGIRGMHDTLPDATPRWQWLEEVIRDVLGRYGYQEIRIPILERTELFARSIGESTDIVTKEMYSFVDRNGEPLTLRPEGTAGCVRAVLEHHLFGEGPGRLWYMGPMFRHERPQKGRFRQFHQMGAEAFGLPGPDIDAELVLLTARLWKELRLEGLALEINNLGNTAARKSYREALLRYFRLHAKELDAATRERLETNPLRLLDSKDPALQPLIREAPRMTDHLDEASARHFAGLRGILDAAGVGYMVNPRLVRGLDYYGGTVFEWISSDLGAQGAVCAGGRYDALVEQFGGRSTPAIGFAMGLDRALELLESAPVSLPDPRPHAYLVVSGENTMAAAMQLAERLREQLPHLRLLTHCGSGSFKSQFRRADRSGAALALILGPEELEQGTVGLKLLRGGAEQWSVAAVDLAAELARRLEL